MILVGLGANLPFAGRTPRHTIEASLPALAGEGIEVVRCSNLFESAPVPDAEQPWYVNGVAVVGTQQDPRTLLSTLHRIEERFGRHRTVLNAPRTLDLDLLDYAGLLSDGWPILPHPRIALRRFVLLPLLEVAPDWRHPATARPASELLAELPDDGTVKVLSKTVE